MFPFAVPGVRLGDGAPALRTDRGTRLLPRLLCPRQRSGARPAIQAISPGYPSRRALSFLRLRRVALQ